MSKKFEVISCYMCPNCSQYDHDGTVYDTTMAQCSAYADGDIVGRVFEDILKTGYIWEECPLDGYHAEEYDFKSSVPVINRHAVNSAFGLKERSSLRQEYDTHISAPEPVPEPKVEMKELVTMIEYSYTEYYYDPNGNSYASHPAKMNEFIHRVRESGGNIISIQTLSDQCKYSVHYSVPVGTYPISI